MKRTAIMLLITTICMAFSQVDSSVFDAPKHFPKPIYNFENNPSNADKVTLGRALFYDPILSKDNTISCASCHSPYNAFAHTDHDLSHGINDEIGTRNAPALFNLAWQPTFMWDGAINHLDVQALAPISHPKEMGETLKNVVVKLQETPLYPNLFYTAFKDSIITGEHVLKALAQFQLTLISANAKYDKVNTGEANFSMQEKKGYELFKANCNSCHTEPLFSSYTFKNNGLSVDSTLNDFGKMAVTSNSKDSLLFKVPSLRNLSFTYPYMHDGRFKKLHQVLNHYTNEITHSSTLAEELKTPIKLSSENKADLISFLLTLNDKSFVFNPNNKFPKNILLPAKDNQN